jgi:glycosyltransferase involved in cell wall biosynthesis
VIPNALDPRYVALATDAAGRTERKRLLERYQVSDRYVLYAGTIKPQKNIPRLIEAFSVLRGELASHPHYSDLRLIIIGDDIAQHPSVRRAVHQMRVGGAVRFLGFVPQDTLQAFYESAELFAFPSLYEGFGLPPLEAMACGTPVLTSNVSSLPEVVGDAAVTVNPENVFEIARGMKEMLLDPKLRETLIARGKERINRFSWHQTARDVLATYREVAGRPAMRSK